MYSRIELGAGTNPIKGEGWTYQDIRKLPNITIVSPCDKLPLKDNSVDELFNRFLLEHIGRHEVVPTLKEWRRVLKEKGRIEIITVDMQELIREYHSGLIDMDWFEYICYGGQDYKENTHISGYDGVKLARQMQEAGFTSIVIEKTKPMKHGDELGCPGLVAIATK